MSVKARLILLVSALLGVGFLSQIISYTGPVQLQDSTQDIVRLESLAKEMRAAMGRFKA